MRRTATIAALAALGLALWASPAAAKVPPQRFVLDGPGLERPITLTDEDSWAFLLGGREAPPSGREAAAEPAGALGPAYEVLAYPEFGDDFPGPEPIEAEPERLTLYPFAEDGAWIRFRQGGWLSQLLRGDQRPRTDTWAVVNQAQLEVLHDRGLPETAPGAPEPVAPAPEAPAEDAAIATTTAGDRASGPGPWLAIGGVAVLGAAFAGRHLVRRKLNPASNG